VKLNIDETDAASGRPVRCVVVAASDVGPALGRLHPHLPKGAAWLVWAERRTEATASSRHGSGAGGSTGHLSHGGRACGSGRAGATRVRNPASFRRLAPHCRSALARYALRRPALDLWTSQWTFRVDQVFTITDRGTAVAGVLDGTLPPSPLRGWIEADGSVRPAHHPSCCCGTAETEWRCCCTTSRRMTFESAA
jgi:hypothetical protein